MLRPRRNSLHGFLIASLMLIWGPAPAATADENLAKKVWTSAARPQESERDADDAAADLAESYKNTIKPIVASHCLDCHGEDDPSGGLPLHAGHLSKLKTASVQDAWLRIEQVLEEGSMPPEEPLSNEDSGKFGNWLSQSIAAARAGELRPPAIPRLLNRQEYQNTMTDLLGIEMDHVLDFPADPRSLDGFRNDASTLRPTSLHMELFLASARRALGRAVVSSEPPAPFRREFLESNLDRWNGDGQRANRLGRKQEFLAHMPKDYPETGPFTVRVQLNAELKPEKGFPLLEVSVGYRPDTQILLREFPLVEVTQTESQEFVFHGYLEDFPLPVRGQGKFPGLVVRVRNRYDDGSPLPKREKKQKEYPDEPGLPKLIVESVTLETPSQENWPPPQHFAILPDSELRAKDPAAYAREVLRSFASKAFRRPVTEEEVDGLVSFFQATQKDYPQFEDAMRETLAFVLIQPSFLYRDYLTESVRRESSSAIDAQQFALASRLSYFLWRSMPDDSLLQLAKDGRLSDADSLLSEVARMLADPRFDRCLEGFVSDWLQLQYIDAVAVDRRIRDWDEDLKRDLMAQPIALFRELVNQNLSALNLLDSSIVMVNEPLAKHYGIENVLGRKLRPVTLTDDLRGGLLGQAGFFLAGSNGKDSHPIRRAVFIRDRLLLDPPAPPPADVPSLDEASKEFAKLSIAKQLEIHREAEGCASCHRDLDPWGLALEEFDAVGRWRGDAKAAKQTESVQTVSFSNGKTLAGMRDVKDYLLSEYRYEFAKSLVSRMLSFALGRSLNLADEAEVDRITLEFASRNFRLRDLFSIIVSSKLFLEG